MDTLKYKVIADENQYEEYSSKLEELVFSDAKTNETRDEINLLTVLIEKWDTEHLASNNLDPVRLLQSLMIDHNMKAGNLASILAIGKSYISDILHYKKGFSKSVIRKLAAYFKVSQEAFNRPYALVVTTRPRVGGKTGRSKIAVKKVAKRTTIKKIAKKSNKKVLAKKAGTAKTRWATD